MVTVQSLRISGGRHDGIRGDEPFRLRIICMTKLLPVQLKRTN